MNYSLWTRRENPCCQKCRYRREDQRKYLPDEMGGIHRKYGEWKIGPKYLGFPCSWDKSPRKMPTSKWTRAWCLSPRKFSRKHWKRWIYHPRVQVSPDKPRAKKEWNHLEYIPERLAKKITKNISEKFGDIFRILENSQKWEARERRSFSEFPNSWENQSSL